MATTPAAALRGIEKHYKEFTLGPIDLEIPRGSIVGLIGENGAGKTTLLKILSGVNPASAGRTELLGSTADDPAARAKIGVVFDDAYFYESLRATEVNNTMRLIYRQQWDDALFADYLRRFQIDEKKQIKEYSRGMRMKLSIATALSHKPELLLLDEATAGLDPVVRGSILDLFMEFIQNENHSILMSSHITSDLDQIADSIAYLHRGKLLFHENKDALHEKYGILRCPASSLATLPGEWVVHTIRNNFSCESLVCNRAGVAARLPEAVCDPAEIDDIMRFISGRDER